MTQPTAGDNKRPKFERYEIVKIELTGQVMSQYLNNTRVVFITCTAEYKTGDDKKSQFTLVVPEEFCSKLKQT